MSDIPTVIDFLVWIGRSEKEEKISHQELIVGATLIVKFLEELEKKEV